MLNVWIKTAVIEKKYAIVECECRRRMSRVDGETAEKSWQGEFIETLKTTRIRSNSKFQTRISMRVN